MLRFRGVYILLAVPAVFALALAGCKGKKTDDDEIGPYRARATDAGAAVEKETPVEVKEYATLKGRIVFDGTPPARSDITPQVKQNPDAEFCMHDKTEDSFKGQFWKVGKDNGVEDVVVWVRAPKGKAFPAPPADKQVTDQPCVIDQPHCAFEPHTSVLLPGQKLIIQNSAPKAHNTAFKGNPFRNPGGNFTLEGGSAEKPNQRVIDNVKPDPRDRINLNCDIHKWMNGILWASETPYATVSRIGKEGQKDGSFEIKNVPANTKVRLVFWHEQPGYFKGGQDGEEITLKPGEHDLGDIKVKPQ